MKTIFGDSERSLVVEIDIRGAGVASSVLIDANIAIVMPGRADVRSISAIRVPSGTSLKFVQRSFWEMHSIQHAKRLGQWPQTNAREVGLVHSLIRWRKYCTIHCTTKLKHALIFNAESVRHISKPGGP